MWHCYQGLQWLPEYIFKHLLETLCIFDEWLGYRVVISPMDGYALPHRNPEMDWNKTERFSQFYASAECADLMPFCVECTGDTVDDDSDELACTSCEDGYGVLNSLEGCFSKFALKSELCIIWGLWLFFQFVAECGDLAYCITCNDADNNGKFDHDDECTECHRGFAVTPGGKGCMSKTMWRNLLPENLLWCRSNLDHKPLLHQSLK